jgi:4-aminobutyrate aminotransferase/(S)-3-amino-2-methylpropionate transaminase
MSSSPTVLASGNPGGIAAPGGTPAPAGARGRSIVLKTEVPGPRSRELMDQRWKAIPQGAHNATPVFMVRGQGVMIEDVDGNQLMDLTGSFGALNVGHAHPRVVKAVQQAAEKFLHTCFHAIMHEPYLRLAERLNAIVPVGEPTEQRQTFFSNSGAEAVENAIKIARHATGRSKVVCFEHAFHGRTLLGMTLTAKAEPYKRGFGPLAAEVYRVPAPYVYRRPEALSAEDYVESVADQAEALMTTMIGAAEIACLILEPVLGEGGFLPVPPRFTQRMARFCKDHGIVYICDEVQTGFGRTGTLFGVEHHGVRPDMMVMAKSLGGGLPISAVTGRSALMNHVHPGGLGGTFGGNALACSAGLEALAVLEEERLVERARHLGQRWEKRLLDLQAKHPIIGDVRGLGAMRAVELVQDQKTKAPAKHEAEEIVERAWTRGLCIVTAGTYGNVLRFLMPLVTTDEQIDEAADILDTCIGEVKIHAH